ncbi:MAG: peptidyl-prolyl cis-trans isomerase SurA, partial [Elusimicrobia bacterium]
MMVDFFRRKMKAFIWLIVAVFVLSIFFMAAGSLFYSNQQTEQAQERAAAAEKARATEEVKSELDYKAPRQVASLVYKGQSETITEGELNKGIKNAWESASRYRGSTAPLKAFKAMMGSLILDNIVKERLVLMEAESQKLDVTKDVEEVLAQNIKKAGGKEQLLAAAKMDEPALRAYFQQQIKQERVIRGITSGKPVADKAVEDYYTAHKNDFKKADGKDVKPLTEVRNEIVAKLKAVVTDDDIKEYYEKHKARWMLPDKVTLRHLMLDPKAERWVKDVKISPEEIAKYYQDHLDDFKAPKKVHLKHIFLDPASDAFKAAAQVTDEELRKAFDEKVPVEQPVQLSEIRISAGETPEEQAKAKARIEEIQGKLKTGASFSALAAEANTGELAAKKGDRGTVKPSELDEPIASTVKELAVGQVSPVIEGDKAFHLLLVTAKTPATEKDPAREKEFEAKKAELTKELEADKREEAARKQLTELKSSLERSDESTPTAAFAESARKSSQATSAADGGDLGVVALGKNEGNRKVDELGAGGYLDENITDA